MTIELPTCLPQSSVCTILTVMYRRFEALRLSHRRIGDAIINDVKPTSFLEPDEFVRLRRNVSRNEAIAHIAEDVNMAFELECPVLFRALLFHLIDGGSIFSIVLDHRVADGFSLEILARTAKNLLQNEAHEFGEQPIFSYTAYGAWQNLWVHYNKKNIDIFFNDHLYCSRKKILSNTRYQVAAAKWKPQGITPWDLKEKQKRTLVSTSNYLLCAYAIALHVVLCDDTPIIAVTSSNRDRKAFENVVGFLASPLPIAINIDLERPLKALLDDVARSSAGTMEFVHTPISYLEESLSRCTDRPAHLTEFGFNFTNFASRISDERYRSNKININRVPIPYVQNSNDSRPWSSRLYFAPTVGDTFVGGFMFFCTSTIERPIAESILDIVTILILNDNIDQKIIDILRLRHRDAAS